MIANQVYHQPSPSFHELLEATMLSSNAHYLHGTYAESQQATRFALIWRWCETNTKRNLTRSQTVWLSNLSPTLTPSSVSLIRAESAIGQAAKQDIEAAKLNPETKREREGHQARAETIKLVAASQHMLRLGLREKALVLARGAASLSEAYRMPDLIKQATDLLNQCHAQGNSCIVVVASSTHGCFCVQRQRPQ